MSDLIYTGVRVTLTGVFRDNGTKALTDPTMVICEVYAPDGTVATPTATKSSVGVYDATFIPTQSGVHRYRFVGTGAASAVGQSFFRVDA